MKISVFGLGKLGGPFVAALADAGHEVTAVDIDPQKVAALVAPPTAQGDPEPGFRTLLSTRRERIRPTRDVRAAVLNTDLTFITVATPSGADGAFDPRFVLEAIAEIGTSLQEKDRYHLVVLVSTVMPGAIGEHILPRLEACAGRKCGPGLGFCYSPEFISLGSVIKGLQRPDLVLIGESDAMAGEKLMALKRTLCRNEPAFVRTNFVNAELAKLAISTFVTTKISYANMLAELCEKLPEADVDVVTATLGLDGRIGKKSLKGGGVYGGPCFPRDNVALASLAKRLGVGTALPDATQAVNHRQVWRLAELIASRLPEDGCVGILGLTYKADTAVTTGSTGIGVAGLLGAREISVVAYDPVTSTVGGGGLGRHLRLMPSLAECVAEADVLLIATDWPEFRKLEDEAFLAGNRPVIIVDCWRMLDRRRLAPNVSYVPIGVGTEAGLPVAAGKD